MREEVEPVKKKEGPEEWIDSADYKKYHVPMPTRQQTHSSLSLVDIGDYSLSVFLPFGVTTFLYTLLNFKSTILTLPFVAFVSSGVVAFVFLLLH